MQLKRLSEKIEDSAPVVKANEEITFDTAALEETKNCSGKN